MAPHNLRVCALLCTFLLLMTDTFGVTGGIAMSNLAVKTNGTATKNGTATNLTTNSVVNGSMVVRITEENSTNSSTPKFKPNWSIDGKKINLKRSIKTPNHIKCWKKCESKKKCKFITWIKKKKKCILFSSYKGGKEKKNCISGPFPTSSSAPPSPAPFNGTGIGNIPSNANESTILTPRITEIDNCGIENSKRIIGGNETAKNQYPWMVRLPSGCGGSLITDRHILTAKHCVDEGTDYWRGKMVKVGVHNQFDATDYKEIPIKEVKWPNGDDHDFAMVILDEAVDLTDETIGTVCLPHESNEEYKGKKVIAMGWGDTIDSGSGQSDVLNHVWLTVSQNEHGPKYLNTDIGNANNEHQSFCHGDSGGPLVYKNIGTGRWIIIGTAYGYLGGNSCLTATTNIWNKITAHYDWIKENVENTVKCLISPGFPNNYPNSYNKRHDFSVTGQAMEITFHDFDVENENTCSYDSLWLYNGYSGASLTSPHGLCGNSLPPKFTIPTSSAILIFKTDGSVTKKGFRLCYKAVDNCVTSPGYPSNYGNNEDHKHSFSLASTSEPMEITFHSFDVEAHPTCSYDRLEFYDVNGNLVKSLCGFSLPPKFTIPTSSADIRFITDGSVTEKGFKFCFKEAVKCPAGWTSLTTGCYHVTQSPATFNNAKALCKSGGHLVEVNDEIEQHTLREWYKDIRSWENERLWLGGSDSVKEGDWRWVHSGESITVSNWHTNEPNNAGGNEDCVVGEQNQFKWQDIACTWSHRAICELSAVAFSRCVGSWCRQSGTSDQFTRCESVRDGGLTCVNPEVRYGSTEGGIPGNHGNNDYDSWCQQLLGFGTNSKATYGARDCTAPKGQLFWCAGYDESGYKWCDNSDGKWKDSTLNAPVWRCATEGITSLTCLHDPPCGKENPGSRISGGSVTRAHQYPWMVRLPIGCGGSLITDRHVLTAKHCVDGGEWRGEKVKVAVHDQTDPNDYLEVVIKDYVWPDGDDHDIAIIILETPVDLNHNNIGTVCLPSSENEDYRGEEAMAMGWGWTPETSDQSRLLQHLKLTVAQRQAKNWLWTKVVFNNEIPLDVCRGDSGGPLVHKEGGKWTVIGTVSSGDWCDYHTGNDGRWNKVTDHLAWINNVIVST